MGKQEKILFVRLIPVFCNSELQIWDFDCDAYQGKTHQTSIARQVMLVGGRLNSYCCGASIADKWQCNDKGVHLGFALL